MYMYYCLILLVVFAVRAPRMCIPYTLEYVCTTLFKCFAVCSATFLEPSATTRENLLLCL